MANRGRLIPLAILKKVCHRTTLVEHVAFTNEYQNKLIFSFKGLHIFCTVLFENICLRNRRHFIITETLVEVWENKK